MKKNSKKVIYKNEIWKVLEEYWAIYATSNTDFTTTICTSVEKPILKYDLESFRGERANAVSASEICHHAVYNNTLLSILGIREDNTLLVGYPDMPTAAVVVLQEVKPVLLNEFSLIIDTLTYTMSIPVLGLDNGRYSIQALQKLAEFLDKEKIKPEDIYTLYERGFDAALKIVKDELNNIGQRQKLK